MSNFSRKDIRAEYEKDNPPMTVEDLKRKLSEFDNGLIVWVGGCEGRICCSEVRSIDGESDADGSDSVLISR